MVDDRAARGMIGTVASIVASVLILVVLAGVYRWGPGAAFQWPCVGVLWALILVGLVALYGYLGYARHAYWRMRHVSPVALLLGAASILAGQRIGPEAGGALIFIAYLVETSVGVALARDYEEEDRLGARLFLAGVSLFVASLPLILVDRRAAIIGIIGDIVKTVGLLMVLAGLARKARSAG